MDFSVVVYAANQSSNPSGLSVAYQVLKTQTTITFVHPSAYGVSASYKEGTQTVTAGPIPAQPGSKYEIIRNLPSDTVYFHD